jgi:hypothetical protein
MQRAPTGLPWQLGGDAFGVNTEREEMSLPVSSCIANSPLGRISLEAESDDFGPSRCAGKRKSGQFVDFCEERIMV